MQKPNLPPRTVAVLGATCVLIGWLLASTLTPPVAQVQSLPPRAPAKAPASAEPTFTERLHLRFPSEVAAPTPRRNPFVFGQRPPRATAPSAAPVVDAAASSFEPAPPAIAGPLFSLAGIGISGEVKTAVLVEGDAVHVLKVGDTLGGYEIVEITENSVTLGQANGLRYVLRLR